MFFLYYKCSRLCRVNLTASWTNMNESELLDWGRRSETFHILQLIENRRRRRRRTIRRRRRELICFFLSVSPTAHFSAHRRGIMGRGVCSIWGLYKTERWDTFSRCRIPGAAFLKMETSSNQISKTEKGTVSDTRVTKETNSENIKGTFGDYSVSSRTSQTSTTFRSPTATVTTVKTKQYIRVSVKK